MKTKSFDLAIVGGGITGAGIARDAASRGMSVALVEAKDYAIGTSSRSSKLIHGGVRYLENFEFSLVFEALAERSLLFEMAPHLVHPLRFVIPIYKKSRVGFWKMLAGMWLYDILALFETPQMHESLLPKETSQRLPLLKNEELIGALEYSDAYMDDDRMVIETLRDAKRLGAEIANHCKVIGCERNDKNIEFLNVKDQLSGEDYKIQADQIISSVGPWTDIFGTSIVPDWKRRLRPTKGVHLTFSRSRFPVDKAVVMGVEKRIIFVIPRNEMVIVGTTDTDFQSDPYNVSTSKEDVQYILKSLEYYFPKAKLKESDIISSYSGVRPLVADGSSSEGKTSREHTLFSCGSNLSFIAGGKYTTYRKMSEDAVDFIIQKMTFDKRMTFSKSNTKGPLNPEISVSELQRIKNCKDELIESYGFSFETIDFLIDRHGKEALDFMDMMRDEFSLYSEKEALWMAEASFAIHQTCCFSLEDFYWRRSPLFLSHKDHGLKYLDSIAKVFSQYFSWSSSETEKKKKLLKEMINKELSWKINF